MSVSVKKGLDGTPPKQYTCDTEVPCVLSRRWLAGSSGFKVDSCPLYSKSLKQRRGMQIAASKNMGALVLNYEAAEAL